MHAWISAYVQAQVHATAATSLPAVLDGPGGVGEPVLGVSGSVCGGKSIIVDKDCY